MRHPGHLLFVSTLLLSLSTTASADCGDAQPLFSAGFESTQEFTLSGSVVGLYQGTVELRADSSLIMSAPLGYRGVYELTIPSVAPEAMLNIRVRGSGDQAFLELATHVGSAGHLEGLARAEGGHVGEWTHGALVVTPESTAKYSLLAAATGGAVGPDCRLAEQQAALDPVEVTRRLAWLKIAMLQGGFGDPAAAQAKTGAATTTLELLMDEAAFDEEIVRVETEHPGLLSQYETLVQESICDHTQDDQRIVLRDRELELGAIKVELISFETANAGRFVATPGFDDTFSFNCADGVMRLEFSGANPQQLWGIIDGVQTRVWHYKDFMELSVLDAGMEQVGLVRTEQSRDHYPDLPDRPDTIYSGTSYRSALLREPVASAFDPANAPGEYSLPLHAFSHPETAFRVQLYADGSGSLIDHAEPLNWNLETDGSLRVELADRDVHLLPFRDDGPVRDVFVTVNFDDGRRQVDAQLAYQRDPAAVVTAADLPMVLRQYGERNDPEYPSFEFDLRADTTAIDTYGRAFGWVLDDDRLVLRGCFSTGQPLYTEPGWGECSYYERRVFDVFQRDGDFWYVFESRDTYQDFNGNGLELTITQRLNRPYGRLPATP